MARGLVASSLAIALTVACAREGANRATPVAIASVPASASPSASPPPPPSSSAPAAPPPVIARAARPTSCEETFPQADMIRDNIADTSITGIGEIVAASRTGTDGGAPPATGYVDLVYELRVVKWLSGSGPEKLVLHQGAEADFKGRASGDLLFFSACSSKDGSAYEPDVGYVFPIEAACRAEAEKIGEAAAKRASAMGKRKRACQRSKM